MAGKTPLTITRVKVQPDGTIEIDARKSMTFTALINPAEFKHEREIEYSGARTLGQLGSEMKFSTTAPDRITFALVLDGTGVVPTATAADSVKEVITWMAELNRVVFQYDGTLHQPSHVRVLWGTLILFGRMESMTTNYTLFKPSGDPLRAKVDLKFVGFISQKQNSLMSNRSSPDLSHEVLVREGDTLPLLCHRIYGDAAYYPEVARHNGLAGFCKLAAGQRLHFPPLA
jgi:hypothetical protein